MDGIYEDSFENTCTKFELKLSEVRVAKVNVQLEAHLVAHRATLLVLACFFAKYCRDFNHPS